MSPVPDHYRGVWVRKLLETPDKRDDSTFVRWLQTSLWHADLRVPFPATATDAPLELANQQGFCGVTELAETLQGEVCTWQRRLDFQPPRAQADAGLMVFEMPYRIIETGVHASYMEVWERLPESTGRFIALAGLDAAGRDTQERFLVAGRYAMRVRPRRTALPPNTPVGQNLAEVLTHHPKLAAALVDFEISFGTLDDGLWSIEQSTLPLLRGARIGFAVQKLDDTQARIDSPAGATYWQILEWTHVLRGL
jgi:hypothetical protein